jgi:putative SOS response-associated peptidase YedK
MRRKWPEEWRLIRALTIRSTDPRELTVPIHNRMPVTVEEKDCNRCMAPANLTQLATHHLHTPVIVLRPVQVGY